MTLNEKDMKIVVFTAGVQHRRVHGLSCGDHKQSVRPTLLYSIFSPKSKSHQPEKIVIVSNQVPTMFLKKCSNVFLKKWCASYSTTRNTGALTQDNITWLEKVSTIFIVILNIVSILTLFLLQVFRENLAPGQKEFTLKEFKKIVPSKNVRIREHLL